MDVFLDQAGPDDISGVVVVSQLENHGGLTATRVALASVPLEGSPQFIWMCRPRRPDNGRKDTR